MKALLFAAGGFFMYTLMDVSIKWLLQSYSLVQVTFFNCLFAMIGLLIWIYPNFHTLKTTRPKVHLTRAIIILFADLLSFYSYGQVALAEAYSLILTMPLFTVIFAVFLGYEKFNLARIGISFFGFMGILLVLKPGYDVIEIALFASLASAIIESIGLLMLTHYQQKETPQAFAFYGLSLLLLVTGIATFFDFKPMPMLDVLYSIGGGISYAMATALVVSAFMIGRPSAVSSLQYTQLIWGLILAYLIWNEVPDSFALVGGVIIALSGLYLLRLKAD